MVKYDKLVLLSQVRETCLGKLFRLFMGGNVPTVPLVTFRVLGASPMVTRKVTMFQLCPYFYTLAGYYAGRGRTRVYSVQTIRSLAV